jgi:RNA polymerase sigma factor (sigma-70 family)
MMTKKLPCGRRCHFLDLLDLMQEGTLGLLQAIEARERRSTETPLKVWVLCWIRSAMLQAIYRHERAVRLPDRVRKRLACLNGAQIEFLTERGRTPSIQDLATRTGFTAEVVTSLLLIQAERFISLDAGEEASESAPLQISAEATATREEAPDSTLHDWLRSEIARLSERDQLVIRHRYGFDGEAAKSTRAVASLLGLSPRVVQDIDRRVRLHLRVALGPRQLDPDGSQVTIAGQSDTSIKKAGGNHGGGLQRVGQQRNLARLSVAHQ